MGIFREAAARLLQSFSEMEGQLNVARERLRHYEELEREIDDAVLFRAKGAAEGDAAEEMRWLEGVGGAVPTAVRRRVQQEQPLRAAHMRREERCHIVPRAITPLDFICDGIDLPHLAVMQIARVSAVGKDQDVGSVQLVVAHHLVELLLGDGQPLVVSRINH